MDQTDRKILYLISEDARESHNILAKKLRISREVLDYRIRKLEASGIIKKCQARINLSNFVYGGYLILVQSCNLTTEVEKILIKKLRSNPKTQYVGKIGGEYDFIIGFTTKNLSELSEYSDFVNNAFQKNKSKSSFLTMVKELKDSFKEIFSDTNKKNEIVSMPIIKEKIEIDGVDATIILNLGRDCKIPSWKISEKIKLTEVAVRKRIKKLEEKNVIINYRTMVDLTKIDFQPYNLFIKTNPRDTEAERALQGLFANERRITYSTKVIGEYNYVVTILVKSNKELNDFIVTLRNNFSNVVTEIIASPVFEVVYHTQIAEDFVKS